MEVAYTVIYSLAYKIFLISVLFQSTIYISRFWKKKQVRPITHAGGRRGVRG